MPKPTQDTTKITSSNEQLEIVIFVGALPMLLAVVIFHFFGWPGFICFFFGANLLLWLVCGLNVNERQEIEDSED